MPHTTLIGIDVGGTFTDFVLLEQGVLWVLKVPTTPDDQSAGILAGLERLGASDEALVVHGTTVATNALLERRGARTGLLTTEGFTDVLAIGRQHRPHLYRLESTRPEPIVPQPWRRGIPERIDSAGQVVQPLDEAAVRREALALGAAGVESIAIVYLFSFLHPEHELRTAAIVREELPDAFITLSSTLLPEYREYERVASTVINAYVQPLVARYLNRLGRALGRRSVRIMQSNGGAIDLDLAADQAARLVLSGPAGGVVGAFALARQATGDERPRLMTFDMGGTSTDVALCPGEVPRSPESHIDSLPLRLPTIDIHTVGAGGGSMARVDAGGALRVGPESAGARPGPACYGRGGIAPTVTDANLVLGRLHPGAFQHGDGRALDVEAARQAIGRISEPLGQSVEHTALGIVRIANATMERALRRVSVERGHDPRAYLLMPFGGAGPLHATDLAAALDMRRILVPLHPGVLSALGLLMADVVSDASHAIHRPAEALLENPAPLAEGVARLCGILLARRPTAETGRRVEAFVDLRYRGQSYELETPLELP
ncbi:MAG: hydantoinase/oxoprolinase family protein, partial [Rhodothermales bacterium]|nr:hydantoinase/oxoprolinase family protein [Rhodothermales bacterium]